MGETLFVSDIHLDAQRQDIIDLFAEFLLDRAANADALYILGDLFEYWLSDDDPADALSSVFDAFSKLHKENVPVFFQHGNRDFLLGKQFCQRYGCQLLTEAHKLNLYGQSAIAMHGDTLCTDDIAYQKFRRKAHNRFLQKIVLSLPLKTRQNIADRLRETSRKAVQSKSEQIMDVNPQETEQTFDQHGVSLLIHGHTHRPAIHIYPKDSVRSARVRAVLGDWYNEGSVLVCTPGHIQLERFDQANCSIEAELALPP